MRRNSRSYDHNDYLKRRNRSIYALLSAAIGLIFTILTILHPAAANNTPKKDQNQTVFQKSIEMKQPIHQKIIEKKIKKETDVKK